MNSTPTPKPEQRRRGIMAHIPDGMYTRAEAAEMVGKSYDTIRRWHREGYYVTEHSIQFGGGTVWLYDEKDIEALKKIAKEIKTGTRYDEQ